MDAIARHDAEVQVRLILEDRVGRCEDDIGEQRVFRMDGRRSVERDDQGC
jgi:hypothetical protein